MTLSMEQFREQLVDYLYGQLEGDALRAFEARLLESADCRSELAGLEQTLERARAGLSASVHEEPPLRVRSAVLAAAAAHVEAERARTELQAHVVSLDERRARAPKTSQRSAHVEGMGRVLRAPWLLSTFGVAAAVALLVLGKNIESPRSELDKQLAAPATETVSSASPSAEPPPGAAPAPVEAPAATEQAKKKRGEARRDQALAAPEAAAKPAPGRVRAPAKGFAEPPASWSRQGADERASQRAAPADGYDEAQRDDLRVEREQAPAQDKVALHAPRGVAPVAAQPAHAAHEAASTAGAGTALGRSYGAAKSAAAPPAAGPAAPVRRAAESADSSSSRMSEKQATLSHDALVHRARQQVAAGSWASAADSYRELLLRFPEDKQAAIFRKQLAWALAQQRRERAR